MEQMNLEDWQESDNQEDKPTKNFFEDLEIESFRCQYCQDVGPCVYCSRGKEIISDLKKTSRRPKKRPR